MYESTTKTHKSTRTLYLPQWALDRLRAIWAERDRPKGRIIGDAKPLQVAWALKLHALRNRLPWVGMRNLRHTWATLAIKAGAAIEHVAEMMGHSNIQTCYRYYMEITAATQRRVQRRLARLVLGKTCDDMYRGIIPASPQELPHGRLVIPCPRIWKSARMRLGLVIMFLASASIHTVLEMPFFR